jgi:hypothetical protein
MVYDPCDLENNVQSFERIFGRKDAEGDCLVIQGIEDGEILLHICLLRSGPFFFKFFPFSPVYNHTLPLNLTTEFSRSITEII